VKHKNIYLIVNWCISNLIFQVGIIGGSGFYTLSELNNPVYRSVKTDYGKPSDELVEGTIGDVPCVVLAR